MLDILVLLIALKAQVIKRQPYFSQASFGSKESPCEVVVFNVSDEYSEIQRIADLVPMMISFAFLSQTSKYFDIFFRKKNHLRRVSPRGWTHCANYFLSQRVK